MGFERGKIRPSESGLWSSGAVGSGENSVAEPDSLLLQPIEESPRPNKLCRENAKGQKDRQPTGTRRDNHHDSNAEECETEKNPKKPFGLLDGLYQHLASSLLSMHTQHRAIQRN